MATVTTQQETSTRASAGAVERNLRVIEDELADLPEMVEHWSEMKEAEQVSALLNWDSLISDRLASLTEQHANGGMTIAQAERYARLLEHLHEAAALFGVMGRSGYLSHIERAVAAVHLH